MNTWEYQTEQQQKFMDDIKPVVPMYYARPRKLLFIAEYMLRQGWCKGQVRDGECYICKKFTNSWVANPSEWGVFLPKPKGNGKGAYYHWGCVMNKMKEGGLE